MTMRTHSAGPVTGGAPSLTIRRFQRALFAAEIDLGERMYAAGIDDGSLGELIVALDHRILRAETARLSTGPLLAQRRELIRQLAAAALEEDAPLPGADAEYERAREALAARKKEIERPAVTARPEPVAVGV